MRIDPGLSMRRDLRKYSRKMNLSEKDHNELVDFAQVIVAEMRYLHTTGKRFLKLPARWRHVPIPTVLSHNTVKDAGSPHAPFHTVQGPSCFGKLHLYKYEIKINFVLNKLCSTRIMEKFKTTVVFFVLFPLGSL